MSEEEGSRPPSVRSTAEQLMQEGWHGLKAANEPARTFVTNGASYERTDAFLLKHGCEIRKDGETNIILYPAGTTRQLLYPTGTDERYRVCLPDGTELREVHGRFGVNNLLLPREMIELEIPKSPSHSEEMP